MERAIKTLMSKANQKDQAEIRRIVEVFSRYMTDVVIGNEVSQQNQSDICADVRKLKDLYEKYGCSFPWQSTMEDIYMTMRTSSESSCMKSIIERSLRNSC